MPRIVGATCLKAGSRGVGGARPGRLAAALLWAVAGVEAARARTETQAHAAVAVDAGPLSNPNFTTTGMATYDVDLDAPPRERWTAAAKAIAPGGLSAEIQQYLANSTGLSVGELELVEKITADLASSFGDELAEELHGLAETLDVDLGALTIINLAYELRKLGGGRPNNTGTEHGACSGLVAADAQGNTFHARNLDWNIPAELYSLIFQCRFVRSGQPVFEGVCVLGTVGAYTGARAGVGAVNINERHLGGSVLSNLWSLVAHKAPPVAVALRNVLEESTTFDAMYAALTNDPVTAPVYFIVSAPNVVGTRGMVLSRDRTKLDDVNAIDTGSGKWFVYESNYDRWTAPPPEDDRRRYALQYIKALGQDDVATQDGVLHIMDLWPIANACTSQTIFLNPNDGTVVGYLRTFIGSPKCETQS